MLTKKTVKNEPRSLTPYMFPVQLKESTFFAVSGAFVEKCVLLLGEIPLSIIKPNYGDYDVDADLPPDVDIAFFGNKPFHAGLTAQWPNLRIQLLTRDLRMPTLIFKPTDTTLTWNDINNPAYYDDVTVGSDAGEVTKTFVYMINTGGFKRTS